MTYEFDAQLQRLEGKIVWTVAYVPFPVGEDYGTKGRVNVTATLDSHAFRTTLLPSRNGHYLAFNQDMKAATGKALGDIVHVTIAPDLAPRIVEVPDGIRAALDAHEGLRAAFDALPDYIKREEVRCILSARTEPTRAKRLADLTDKLQNGTRA